MKRIAPALALCALLAAALPAQALWDRAAAEGQLTRKGEEFGPTVRALLDAMARSATAS